MELVGYSSNGKKKFWKVQVVCEEDTVYLETTFGYSSGKKQVTRKLIKGKNIGKSNETSDLEQANLVAISCANEKRDEGYSEESDEPPVFKIPSPMLAQDFCKHKSHIDFPCFVQRKYDGIRCLWVPGAGLFSRNKKQIHGFDEMVVELEQFCPSTILDGELYSETLGFQDLVSLIKDEKKKDKSSIKLVVYDVVSKDVFCKRFVAFSKQWKPMKNVILAETFAAESVADVEDALETFVADGYEGVVIRNIDSFYKNSRSFDLQKYKKFMDQEFEIVDFCSGEGMEEGCVIWRCKSVGPEGNSEEKFFNCRPTGTRDERRKLFENGKKFIGKMLNVKFQSWTDDSLPRFPIGVYIRED